MLAFRTLMALTAVGVLVACSSGDAGGAGLLTTPSPVVTAIVDSNGTDPNPELSEPFPAYWTLDPSFPPDPESTLLHLIVTERQCASGVPPTGRIEASVSESTTAVEVSVIVNSVGGHANCPSNPPTAFTVRLSEPLGDRRLIGMQPPP